jgi:hypothetical protein
MPVVTGRGRRGEDHLFDASGPSFAEATVNRLRALAVG